MRHSKNHNYLNASETHGEAKKRIGEKGYSLTKMNCQHFVCEVRNGNSVSPEVEGVMKGALYTSLFALGSAIMIVAGVAAK